MKIKDKEPFYSDGLSFECTRCGGCCSGFPGYVWLSEAELFRLCDFRGLDPAVFAGRFTRVVRGFGPPRLSLIEKDGFDCVFFDDGCTVYEARPFQCSSFPFWKRNLVSPASWERTADFCPGVNRGKRYSHEEIEDLLLRVPDYNVRHFSARARRAIGF
ncbi:MAG: YkgJ family cysteine cluster protein [Spirochaetes bacterium]|nr:YkgJ family cysteine cluster protein [Spirochaetota bacterium]